MKKKKVSREFVFYFIAALSSAASDLLAFTALMHLGVYFFYSQMISRVVGGVISFIINKNFSFNTNRKRTLIEIRRFLLLYFVSFNLVLLLLWLVHEKWDLPLLYAKPMCDSIGFVFNFFVMKLYVYAQTRGLIATSSNFLRTRRTNR